MTVAGQSFQRTPQMALQRFEPSLACDSWHVVRAGLHTLVGDVVSIVQGECVCLALQLTPPGAHSAEDPNGSVSEA